MCPNCNKDFLPTSNHKMCPTCRYHSNKDTCVCGSVKAKSSSICASCHASNQSMKTNGNWKGGKTIHKSGYVMVRTPGHPRSKSNNGYVFEHIIIMEEYIGRHLVASENVHHINGIKNDNRIENLELWTRPQPSGIRSSDAVAWAKEILRLYSPESLVE